MRFRNFKKRNKFFYELTLLLLIFLFDFQILIKPDINF